MPGTIWIVEDRNQREALDAMCRCLRRFQHARIVGVVAEVDAGGPHRAKAAARSKAHLSYQEEGPAALPMRLKGQSIYQLARHVREV